MKRLKSSFISRSAARNFGPVWYHPIMRSRAAQIHKNHHYAKNAPKNAALRTVDLLEHLEHRLDIIVVQEPRLGIPIVLLKRHAE